MTVYNGENTIKKTIDSILNQTYEDFEFIIVNDGSTDSTGDILFEYEQKDKRINIIKADKIGRSKALNIALKKCTGHFVANIDADDEAHPDRLMREYKFLNLHNEVALVSSESEIIVEEEEVNWENYNKDTFEAVAVNQILKRTNPISHPSIMVNMNVVERGDFEYNERLDKVVDYDLWIRLHKKGYSLMMIKEKLIAKRIHENQSFENRNRKKYLRAIKQVQLSNFRNELKFSDYFFINCKLLYGTLPQKLRMRIKKK